jgi:hypothetical protein
MEIISKLKNVLFCSKFVFVILLKVFDGDHLKVEERFVDKFKLLKSFLFRSLMEIISKLKNGAFELDLDEIRHDTRVIQPPLDSLEGYG